jgi:hypothetical protein
MAAYTALLPGAIWGTPGERVAGIISSPSAGGSHPTDTDHGADVAGGETQASATIDPPPDEAEGAASGGTSPGSPLLHPDPESPLVTPVTPGPVVDVDVDEVDVPAEGWSVAPATGLMAESGGISLPDTGETPAPPDTGVSAVADGNGEPADPAFVAAGKLLGPEEG